MDQRLRRSPVRRWRRSYGLPGAPVSPSPARFRRLPRERREPGPPGRSSRRSRAASTSSTPRRTTPTAAASARGPRPGEAIRRGRIARRSWSSRRSATCRREPRPGPGARPRAAIPEWCTTSPNAGTASTRISGGPARLGRSGASTRDARSPPPQPRVALTDAAHTSQSSTTAARVLPPARRGVSFPEERVAAGTLVVRRVSNTVAHPSMIRRRPA
jgi:hypothetical protein